MLKYFAKTGRTPPFVLANDNNIKNILTNLNNLSETKKLSLEYYAENLMPEHLITFYTNILKEI
jgi:hypothetical protein